MIHCPHSILIVMLLFNVLAIYKDWSLNKKICETYRSCKTGNPTIDPLNEVPDNELEKEQDRISSLKIIEKRYSFMMEDVWFITLQYFFFEKFIVFNHVHGKYEEFYNENFVQNFGFLIFNMIFTSLVGLLGLQTIPFCIKMIKNGNVKSKIFYLMTIIQISLQTSLPIARMTLVTYEIVTAWTYWTGLLPKGLDYYYIEYLRQCTLYDFGEKSLIAQPFSRSCLLWTFSSEYTSYDDSIYDTPVHYRRRRNVTIGDWWFILNCIASIVLGAILSIWMKLDSDFRNSYKPKTFDTIRLVCPQPPDQPSSQPSDQPSSQPSSQPPNQLRNKSTKGPNVITFDALLYKLTVK